MIQEANRQANIMIHALTHLQITQTVTHQDHITTILDQGVIGRSLQLEFRLVEDMNQRFFKVNTDLLFVKDHHVGHNMHIVKEQVHLSQDHFNDVTDTSRKHKEWNRACLTEAQDLIHMGSQLQFDLSGHLYQV